MATTEDRRRVCATPGCKTRIRASNESLVCDPCRAKSAVKAEETEVAAREARTEAERAAEEGSVPCRYYTCPKAATRGIGSRSPRWQNLCDEHYELEVQKASASAGKVAQERAEGLRPPLPPPANRSSSRTGSRAVPDLEHGPQQVPARPERIEISGVRTARAERLVRLAKQLDVIDAQIKLLRESAEPLMTEWDVLVAEIYELPELGSGPLDLAQDVSDSAPHD